MKLQVKGRALVANGELADYIHRRAQFALGRFAGRIANMTVRLSDANGPRGGVDKCCDVRVDAGLSRPVIVRERQSDMHTAVALAVDRAGRTVARMVRLGRRGAARVDLDE